MEKYLFNAYLQYMKDNKETFWPKLLKLPIHILILIGLSLGCIPSALVASFLHKFWLTWTFIGAEFIFVLISWLCLEYYQIKTAHVGFQEYKQHCEKLSEHLKKYDLKTLENIEEILSRITANVNEMKAEYEKRNDHLFKWTQTLIVPIILAVITTVITKQNEFEVMVTNVTAIIMIFAVLYGAFAFLRNLQAFPLKRKIEQLECFATDLQGVLDYKRMQEKEN